MEISPRYLAEAVLTGFALASVAAAPAQAQELGPATSYSRDSGLVTRVDYYPDWDLRITGVCFSGPDAGYSQGIGYVEATSGKGPARIVVYRPKNGSWYDGTETEDGAARALIAGGLESDVEVTVETTISGSEEEITRQEVHDVIVGFDCRDGVAGTTKSIRFDQVKH